MMFRVLIQISTGAHVLGVGSELGRDDLIRAGVPAGQIEDMVEAGALETVDGANTRGEGDALSALAPPEGSAGMHDWPAADAPMSATPPADAPMGATPPAWRNQLIIDAIHTLDPAHAKAWTVDGKPQVTAIEAVTGSRITAAERDAAWQMLQGAAS